MMVIIINTTAVIFQDGMDEFFADEDTKVYWVSFLDGLQRMLLFTEDLAVAANAQEVTMVALSLLLWCQFIVTAVMVSLLLR